MEENRELMELLKKIHRSNSIQTIVCSILCVLALVAAVCCVVLFVKVYEILPQMNVVFAQLETIMTNLEQTSQQLADVDFQAMVQDVDALVIAGQQSLEQTMGKLETIDFDALNGAIDDLADVIEPLAKFFKVFN